MLGFVGRTILLLVVIALGVLFDAAMLRSRNVGLALGIRVLAGLATGALAVWAFDLEGMTRAVVLLGSAAPIGFSAVVVASRESRTAIWRRARHPSRCCSASSTYRWGSGC